MLAGPFKQTRDGGGIKPRSLIYVVKARSNIKKQDNKNLETTGQLDGKATNQQDL
jgi:hypothetical protein